MCKNQHNTIKHHLMDKKYTQNTVNNHNTIQTNIGIEHARQTTKMYVVSTAG